MTEWHNAKTYWIFSKVVTIFDGGYVEGVVTIATVDKLDMLLDESTVRIW